MLLNSSMYMNSVFSVIRLGSFSKTLYLLITPDFPKLVQMSLTLFPCFKQGTRGIHFQFKFGIISYHLVVLGIQFLGSTIRNQLGRLRFQS